MNEILKKSSQEADAVPEESKRLFSLWRVLVLIVLGMIFFNLMMMILTGKLIEEEGLLHTVLSLIPTLLFMSFFGLIITPAPIGLALYAFSVETLYARRVFTNFWLFCLFGGVVGLGIFAGFGLLLTGDIGVKTRMLVAMFVSHTLTTMVVYQNKRKDRDGGFFSLPKDATGDPLPIPTWVYMMTALACITIILAYPKRGLPRLKLPSK